MSKRKILPTRRLVMTQDQHERAGCFIKTLITRREPIKVRPQTTKAGAIACAVRACLALARSCHDLKYSIAVVHVEFVAGYVFLVIAWRLPEAAMIHSSALPL